MKNIINANICTSFELFENGNNFLVKICQPKILKNEFDIDFEINYKNFLIEILGFENSQ